MSTVYTAEERAFIWLSSCSGLDVRGQVALLRSVGDPARVKVEEDKLGAVLRELEKYGAFAVTLVSEDYPHELKAITTPPLVLYGAGNRALLKERKFCIVGSRITPPWAEKLGKNIAEALSEQFAIVTGLAEGGDSAAIDGALPSGKLISVLPCGLKGCYPAAHTSKKAKIREKGLLLSESFFDTGVQRHFFHARNRILAGLSEGVLVLSAGVKSGALITANQAVEHGREVFAFPYNPGIAQGVGCNELIKKGAYLAAGVEDIFACFRIEKREKSIPSLSSEEARVLEVLRAAGELHTAEIAVRAGLQIFEASAVLSALELKGQAVKAGGNKYSAI